MALVSSPSVDGVLFGLAAKAASDVRLPASGIIAIDVRRLPAFDDKRFFVPDFPQWSANPLPQTSLSAFVYVAHGVFGI